MRLRPTCTSPRAAALIVLAATLAVSLVASSPAAAAESPSRFPAAGQLMWPSVTVRTAPRPTARRKMVLYELRRDYRPQIVLAIGMRRIGYVAPTSAALTLANTSGGPALRLTARARGEDGNEVRVSVRPDLVELFAGGTIFQFANGADLAGLANQINASSAPVTAAVTADGTALAPLEWRSLEGGSNGRPGRVWYRLNLPIRPFGQTGWVPAESVDVRTTTRRVVIRRRAKVLEVFRGGRRIFRTRVAVGRPDRKTPLGSFYVAAKYVPPRNALVSTYALELSAPAGLPDFLRGGVVGIHGTPATHTIGKAASNGCIRVAPRVALALKRLVPLGTPVRVVR